MQLLQVALRVLRSSLEIFMSEQKLLHDVW